MAGNPEPRWRHWLLLGRGRGWASALALAASLLLLLPDPGPIPALRLHAFDAWQQWFPRERRGQPVAIVAIDEASLAEFGQWPWPRDLLAELVDRVAARKPAGIGLDLILSEPDRTSPDRLAAQYQQREPALATRMAAMPSHDRLLAEALARAGAVVGVAGSDELGDGGEGFAPVRTLGPQPTLHAFVGGNRNLPEIERGAAGRGLFNSLPDGDGVVRRIPAVATVAGHPLLSLPLECLRLVTGLPVFTLDASGQGPLTLVLGELAIPLEDDGSLWLHYAPLNHQRSVSAADVLRGRDDPELLVDAVALIGVTGQGLVDEQLTPLGQRVPGVEIHAETLENVIDGAALRRPSWARAVEAAAFASLALLAVVWMPRLRPRRSPWLFVASVAALQLGGWAAFSGARLLFDAWTPLLGLALLQGVLTAATLVRSDSERRRLAVRVEQQREEAARTAGELEAARRIQGGMLPLPANVVGNDSRLSLYACMRPAREVGGDLYDFFPLDRRRLFLVVGDVAGKGVPAALFMAVSKALTRATARRAALLGPSGLARLVADLNTELSRDNPEDFFVTLLALVLDLDSGTLTYCNAGHEPPLVLRGDGRVQALEQGGGPPLCVLDPAEFVGGEARLSPGDLLVLVSDGITEAVAGDGRLYGRAALREALESSPARSGPVEELGRELLAGVDAFEAGAGTADDQTLLLLRWLGSASDAV